jgi:hypothetical protein
VIKLASEDAKGDGSEEYARYIPMAGKDLAGILARRTAARRMKRKHTVTLAEFIFHHNGKQIVDIREAWASAIPQGGTPASGIPHVAQHGSSHHGRCRYLSGCGKIHHRPQNRQHVLKV